MSPPHFTGHVDTSSCVSVLINALTESAHGMQSSEIEPAGEESALARGALVQALQARVTTLERELRDSDNTHRLRSALF